MCWSSGAGRYGTVGFLTTASLLVNWIITSNCCVFAGLETIHELTKSSRKPQDLRIDLEDTRGNKSYALYDNFVVENEENKFKLKSVGKYRGTAGWFLLLRLQNVTSRI